MGYTLQQLQAMGATPGAPATSASSTPKKRYTYDELVKAGATPTTPAPKEEGSGFLKGLVSAPLTMVARPFQAAAGLGQVALGGSFGAYDPEAIDRFSSKYSAGLIAPTPKNVGDIKKDVGRGIQTVALGTAAPLAGGAAFGLGSSLEGGGDLFSVDTAFNTVLGAGFGKASTWIGKPLINAAGKVVGTITPQILKDVAGKGADAMTKFAAQHEILPAAVRPAVNKIPTAMEAVDAGVSKVLSGTKGTVGKLFRSQYPGATGSGQRYYEKVEREALIKPTSLPNPSYKGASEVYKDANKRGIDIGKVASENKIYATDLQDEGMYSTMDAVDALRKETMQKGPDLLRPALQEAEAGVQRIPISQVRARMIEQVNKVPKANLTDAERAKLISNITSEFSDGSAADVAHPGGFSLTDLYDNKLSSGSNVIYKTLAPTVADNLSNTYYKSQRKVFEELLEKNAPKDLDIPAFSKKLEERFMLADYLEKLHGKKAPQSLFKKALKTGAKLAGASIGGSGGNIFGAFGGYHAGGVAIDAFQNASNPIKNAYLRSIEKAEPEIFQAFKSYFGDKQVEKWMRMKLPPGSTIFAGAPTPDLSVNKFANNLKQENQRLSNIYQLPAPQPRTIVPNRSGTPNQIGRPYGPGEIK